MNQRIDYQQRKQIDDFIQKELENGVGLCNILSNAKENKYTELNEIFEKKNKCTCSYFVYRCCNSYVIQKYFTVKDKLSKIRLKK